MLCGNCSKTSGALVLLFGIIFLLQDLGIWSFWGINWWTIAFILAGVGAICSSCCAECQAGCCGSVPSTVKVVKKK